MLLTTEKGKDLPDTLCFFFSIMNSFVQFSAEILTHPWTCHSGFYMVALRMVFAPQRMEIGIFFLTYTAVAGEFSRNLSLFDCTSFFHVRMVQREKTLLI